MAKRPTVTPGPIAIVAHTHPAITKGGAEIAAYALYEGLKRLGIETIFIAACLAEDRNRFRPASADEYALITERTHYDDFYTISAPETTRQLLAILAHRRVHLVNFHHHINIGLNSFRALSMLTQIPFFVTFHEFTAICANQGQMVTRPARRLCAQATPIACATCFPERPPEQFQLRRHFMLNSLRLAAGYIAPSQFLADRFIAWGLPAAKFAIIENGLRALPPQPAPPLPHTREKPWIIGTFGQITPNKGIDTVLDALDLIADQPALARRLRLRIHGGLSGQSADFTARFETAIATHDFATYEGPYANDDIFDLMAKCDFVLVPSTWWENSPVVIQEAFATGRPVICTGIGGLAEKVPPGTAGLHFRRNDPVDLVRALAEAADTRIYKSLCAGLPSAYDTITMAQAYLAAFRQGRKEAVLF
jgi:glycosyltransferase involved in cell wall biosynthesis